MQQFTTEAQTGICEDGAGGWGEKEELGIIVIVLKTSVDGGLTIDKEVEDVSAETRGIGAAKNPLTALSQEPEVSMK